MPSVKERVARGARLLDAQRPGWAGEIKTEQLVMSDKCQCVLGQVFGEYRNGVKAILPPTYAFGHSMDNGFDAEGRADKVPSRGSYEALEVAWLAEIEARR